MPAAAKRVSPASAVVLRPVVGDEQRQRLAGPGVGGAPDADVDLRAEPAPRDHRAAGSARARPPAASQRRRGVAGEQEDGLVAERAGRLVRVARVADARGVAVVVDDLELVLQPRYGRQRELQLPLAVVAGVVGLGERQVGAQPHGGVPLIRVGQAKEHPLMMAGSAAARFVLTSVPPISENARTRTTGAPGPGPRARRP